MLCIFTVQKALEAWYAWCWVVGGHVCTFSVGEHSTQDCLYLAEGIQNLYLSLQGCKALVLVSCHFPTVEATMAALAEGEKPQLQSHRLNPPYHLKEDNVGLLECWFLEHLGCMVLGMDGTQCYAVPASPCIGRASTPRLNTNDDSDSVGYVRSTPHPVPYSPSFLHPHPHPANLF